MPCDRPMYFTSSRDGYAYLWAQRLDRAPHGCSMWRITACSSACVHTPPLLVLSGPALGVVGHPMNWPSRPFCELVVYAKMIQLKTS
jgi:hypothetical protein